MSAQQLQGTFERLHEQGEELQLKHQHMQREQRRAMNTARSRPQSAQVHKDVLQRLYTDDVRARDALHARRAHIAMRSLEAKKLCNVTAVGRQAKSTLLAGQRPVPSKAAAPRGLPQPLAPTLLNIYGEDILELPEADWQTLLARDRNAPPTELWALETG